MFKANKIARIMFVSNIHIKMLRRGVLLFFLAITLLPSTAWAQSKEVVAQKGEGIYRLLTRNGYSASESMDDFIALNKNSLGKNNTLLAGVKYKLPDTSGGGTSASTSSSKTKTEVSKTKPPLKTVHYEIFGKEHADVEIVSSELKGAIYYLVAGHGGPDPGAVGKYNGYEVCEDEYAYDVTLRLAKNLISEGATVYMITRDKNDGIRDDVHLKADKDERCYPNKTIPLNHIKRLRQRTDAVNQLYTKNKGKFQRMLALHIDSRGSKENIDIFFYYDKRSKTGKKASIILRDTVKKKYKEVQPNRGYSGTVTPRNLYVIRNTWPPTVFIELGNMNHQRDIKRLVEYDNRQAVANWLTLGLKEDFKTNK